MSAPQNRRALVPCILSRNIWVCKVYWASLGKTAMRNEGPSIWSKGKVELWWITKKAYLELSSQSFRGEVKGLGLCTPHHQSVMWYRLHAGDSLGQGSFLWLRQVPVRGLVFSCQPLGACMTQSWKGKSVQGTTEPTIVILCTGASACFI